MKTLLIAVVLVLGLASTSFASLVLDVTNNTGGKTLVFSPGALSNSYTNIRLWAIVTGSDSNPYNDGITSVIANMIITITYGSVTNMIGFNVMTKATAFSSATGQPGLSQDLNGDGIKDWGSNVPNPADPGYAYFITKDMPNPIYGDTLYAPQPTPSGNGMRYLLGTFRLAVGSGGLGGAGGFSINAQIPTYPGTTAKGIWFEDNATWPPTDEFGDPNPLWNPTDPTYRKLWLEPTQGSTGIMSVGAPLGPSEPSTLILVVTGALTLPLIYRRRKKMRQPSSASIN